MKKIIKTEIPDSKIDLSAVKDTDIVILKVHDSIYVAIELDSSLANKWVFKKIGQPNNPLGNIRHKTLYDLCDTYTGSELFLMETKEDFLNIP